MSDTQFVNLNDLASYLRSELEHKKFILLYAYNGTGKTRLSTAFKDFGKSTDERDTLYFNAFTQDLFFWDNDLEGDSERKLIINSASSFFAGLAEMEIDNRIRPFLNRFADFDFVIDTSNWEVTFSREISDGTISTTAENIKVSRGEENIFIWCFFLAIAQLAMDGAEAYSWVKFIYIDDPISSLDEHNAISVASNLAELLKRGESQLKTVISTHHTLFYNVLCNELNRPLQFFLSIGQQLSRYNLRETGKTPFFHHVALLAELYEAERSGRLFTYHFNMLRSILEKTASFHGYKHFSACIKTDDDDDEGILHTRLVNILSHGNYSLYEPQEMLEENKSYFRKILHDFIQRYPFDPDLFTEPPEVAISSAVDVAQPVTPAKQRAITTKKTASRAPKKPSAS